jgi:hypothetical protein
MEPAAGSQKSDQLQKEAAADHYLSEKQALF